MKCVGDFVTDDKDGGGGTGDSENQLMKFYGLGRRDTEGRGNIS